METWKKREDPKYQRNVDEFVHREVYYCASYLVSELAKDEKYMDDLLPVCIQDDWQSAGEENGIELKWDNGIWQYSTEESRALYNSLLGDYQEALNRGANVEDLESPEEPWIDLDADTKPEAWREACEEERIEPYQNEAYEHWIVSDWLAGKLEEKGEMVIRDFLGFTIWGRTCTGQSISQDGVICEIYDEGPGQYDKE